MNDRDFKLLVREYFQAVSKNRHTFTYPEKLATFDRVNYYEEKILRELEDFTRRDIEELPFKEK